MGTIVPRTRGNGTTGYTAQIRIRRDGAAVHTESKTFDHKRVAAAWLKKREGELAQPRALERAKIADPPLKEIIERYISESKKKIGRTKTQVLRSIQRNDIGILRGSAIGSAEIIAFLQDIDAEPQTRANYLSHLGAVFSVARPAWKYPLAMQAMEDARVVAKKLGLVSKSKQRDRRPTLAELDKILTFFTERLQRHSDAIPMPIVIAFAIFSTRRQEEITTIAWPDYEPANARQMVRNMKNPGEKEGNDVWCDVGPEAIRLIGATPQVEGEDRIFPFNPRTISTSFTDAMKTLGIEDLHFHDLRHDGISRQFEMGGTIPRVAGVSGHRTWQSLQRYSHIRQVGDKYANWPWLEKLAGPAA